MITVTGRHAAAALLTVSGVFVLGLGVFGIVRRHLTPHEVIAGAIGFVVAFASRLWLRRDKRSGGAA